MGAEPVLDELIAALQQLRARVIQVRAGGHGDDELPGMLISVLAINSRLETSRIPHAIDEIPERLEKMDQSIALTRALRAIHPDYLLDTIDAAIGLAEGQR